jgi:hypothetical protein
LAINYLNPHPFLAVRSIAAELDRKASSEDIILPRHDPDPGRKITAGAKNPRIWDELRS